MKEYYYTAKDTAGKVVKAKVEAATPQDAAKLLMERQLFPIDIKEPGEAGLSARLSEFSQDVRRVSSKDRVIFTRQMATLIQAGLPLAKSLQIMVDQIDNVQLRKTVQGISNSVQGGNTLAKSMAEYPDIFNMIYISMVEAGELGGNLDDTMLRLADQEEKSQEIRSKVRSALTYPVVVLAVLIAVTVLMISLVIPQVANMYTELNQPLPLLTSILLAVSEFLRRFWYLAILLLVAAIFAVRLYIKTDKGREHFDHFKLNVPGVSLIVKKVYMARFTRTMSSLVNSGVSVLQALKITSTAINNIHLERAIKEVAVRVKAGDPISKPVSSNPVFLPLVGQMIEVGEQTGSLGDSMDKVANYFEAEVDEAMETISTLIEPATMVILGLMVAFLVGAVLLPIYGLVSNIR